jgi:hypothetical protein
MSNTTLVRGAAIAGLAICALAGGTTVASAADTATACVNGAINYPDCTPIAGGTTTGTGVATGTGADTPTGGGATTVVSGGSGTTESSAAATSLPFTGFEAGAAAAVGLAALGAGTVFIVGSRRRRSPSSSAAV